MRENFFWHKLHSLTGIIPIGYYLVQHLALNSFSLGGAASFNAVIDFFEGLPYHVLMGMKIFVVWLPLLFHAVYGVFIVARGTVAPGNMAYKNFGGRYYTWQRISGLVAFAFLVYHMTTTSVMAKIQGVQIIQYEAWADKLAGGIFPYAVLLLYVVGILASTYHLSYGLWSFCIRWGITISDRAQRATAKVSVGAFFALTALGLIALFGFFNPILESNYGDNHGGTQVEAEAGVFPASYEVITE